MDLTNLGPMRFGRYPTPVEPVPALSASGSVLWVKRDDLTHEGYGGNKVRKLEYLLARERALGTTRIVTAGAAGSHHVLATSYFGKLAGFEVEAVLVPQPRTEHAVEALRASLALGLRAFPVKSWGAVPLALARRIASGASFIPVGGSSVAGTMGYVEAAHELSVQVRRGALPEPDVCVVALGSGGTAAGLVAGFAKLRMKTTVVGVYVSKPVALSRALAIHLARACGHVANTSDPRSVGRWLTFDARFLGAGYGHATMIGDEATRDAQHARLVLDPTYTAKGFAGALWQVRARRAAHVLYWHTLSSAPIRPLMIGAVEEPMLDPGLRALFAPLRR